MQINLIRNLFYSFLMFLLSSCYLRAEIKDNHESLSSKSKVQLNIGNTNLSINETNVNENIQSLVEVTLMSSVDYSISFQVHAVSGYAIESLDFNLAQTQFEILPGQNKISIPITIIGDSMGEGDENFKIIFSSNLQQVNFQKSEINVLIIDDDPIVLNVEALFPTNGTDFFSFVENQLDRPIVEVNDAACSIIPIGQFDKCLDGGVYRKVIAVGQHSCSGLTLSDDLDVFNWICSEEADPVFFYSDGIKKGKGLKELLNPSAFKQNFVTLSKGAGTIASSVAASWWGNPVLPILLNSGGTDPRLALNSSGAIFTVNGSGASRGITISSPRTGLVVLSGTLTSTGSTVGDCDSSGGGIDQCLILLETGASQFYIEGQFQGTANLDSVISIDSSAGGGSVRMGVIKNSSISGVGIGKGVDTTSTDVEGLRIESTHVKGFQTGLMLLSIGQNKLLYDLEVSDCSFAAIYESINSWNSKYIKLKIINNTGDGFVGLPWLSHVQDFVGANNGGSAISAINFYSIYKNIFLVGNGSSSDISLTFGTINNLTAMNNQFTGLGLFNSSNSSGVSNLLISNNGTGLQVSGSGVPFSNLWLTDNNVGINFASSSSGSNFQGQLALGNTTNCQFSSVGVNPGLTGVNCDNQGPSAAARSLGASAIGYLQGKITSEIVNFHFTGLSIASSIMDWFRFENPYRVWATETAGDFLGGSRGICSGGASCRIWDLRIKETALGVYNANGVFVPNGICPASVQGDMTESYQYPVVSHYLRFATEILFDRIGNDNGLCESNEACIYSPHIGAYQGEGDYLQNSCVFQDGVGSQPVTGVKMFAYPQ